ncbi:DUF1476 domain-containing protein [Microbaculum sp. FT89]|uniref:DUF1476 domain-containing protein n=1 Tax=Microbaculum sp. FT89 TaxID=3447298 RepID=UPI003F529BA2
MTIFNDREMAFEKKFVRDEETRFRALALRNKLFGQWAANQLGLTGDAADAYVEDIRNKVADRAGEEIVVSKVRDDLSASGRDVSEHQIRYRLTELLHDAITQVTSGGR